MSVHVFKDRSREPDPRLAVPAPGWRCATPLALRFSRSRRSDALAVSPGMIERVFPTDPDDLAVRPGRRPAARRGGRSPGPERGANEEMPPIPADHLRWLKRISETHDTCLRADSELPILAHFLDNRLVLNYRNGKDWYDIHPLLREVVDAASRRWSCALTTLVEDTGNWLLRHSEWQDGFSLVFLFADEGGPSGRVCTESAAGFCRSSAAARRARRVSR